MSYSDCEITGRMSRLTQTPEAALDVQQQAGIAEDPASRDCWQILSRTRRGFDSQAAKSVSV